MEEIEKFVNEEVGGFSLRKVGETYWENVEVRISQEGEGYEIQVFLEAGNFVGDEAIKREQKMRKFHYSELGRAIEKIFWIFIKLSTTNADPRDLLF